MKKGKNNLREKDVELRQRSGEKTVHIIRKEGSRRNPLHLLLALEKERKTVEKEKSEKRVQKKTVPVCAFKKRLTRLWPVSRKAGGREKRKEGKPTADPEGKGRPVEAKSKSSKRRGCLPRRGVDSCLGKEGGKGPYKRKDH